MEKIAYILIITLTTTLVANDLDKYCLSCHIQNKLPTKAIYKRYLMRFSTKKNMKNAMFNYLKEPTIQNSIMPKEFFLKFKPKNSLNLEDKQLDYLIDLFLDKYDIKKRLK